MDAAVVLGHEAKLVGFGLHLHRSFAGHLVIPLRGSYLKRCKPNVRQFRTDHWLQFRIQERENERTPGPHWDRGQRKAWRTSAGCCQRSG